jgi:uncharacterized RDD family membrane protein YckC
MASPASFVAGPGKRVAAFVFDFIVAFMLFAAFAACAEKQDDVTLYWAFAACAALYNFAFVVLQGGTTWGKMAQDICVVSVSGTAPTAWQGLVRAAVRFLPFGLIAVPWRAGAPFEEAASAAIEIAFLLMWIADFALLRQSPTRQTIADRLARTLVVNMPPRQPHPAPAIPMFSATDREFGTPPKDPRFVFDFNAR